MADTYEKDLAQKSSLTTSDFIRVVGSDNVSYKQLVSSVANATGSAYLGAFSASSDEDAVKQALSALKTKYSSESSSTENLPKVVSFMRSGAWGFVGVAWIRSTTVEMTAVRYTDGITYFGKDVSNTQTVITQPTRAEVDALTTVTTPTGATFSSKLSNTELAIRRCGKHVVGHAVFRADQALPGNGETILTGLPYSNYRLQVMGICVAGSESYKTKRFAIYNGTLSTYWSGTDFISGDTWLVNFSYIATN